jgi:hypothetical protein
VTVYLTYPKCEPEVAAFVAQDSCPSCNEANYIESVREEGTYVDDEKGLTTTLNGKQLGLRFHPYKDYLCVNCGAEFRVYLGPVAIEIIREATRE